MRRQAHPVFCEAAGASLALFRRNGREETIHTSLTRRDVPYRFDEYAYAAVVADGIGGDGAGAVAARLAVSTLAQLELRFGEWNMRIDPQVAADIMDRSRWFYDRAHEAVRRWQRAHQEMGRIAAALTAVFSAGNDLFVAHVGHCRCYLFRAGVLTQLTRDQTLRAHRRDAAADASGAGAGGRRAHSDKRDRRGRERAECGRPREACRVQKSRHAARTYS